MEMNLNELKEVVVLLGAGSMGTAIVRRICVNRKILFGDISQAKLDQVAKEFTYAGYDVATCVVDASSKESVEAFANYAASLGEVKYFIDTAGASPSQSSPEHIIELDLIGTAYAIDAFGKVMAQGGAGLIVASQTGYMKRIPYEVEKQFMLTPSDELKDIEYLKTEAITGSGTAYMVAKRANQLRVKGAAATSWADRRARINTISPGIIVTPLAYDEFNAPGTTYQHMIETSPARRVGTSDEIAEAGAFLLNAGFVTGTDLLIDGGVIAAIDTGKYKLGGKR